MNLITDPLRALVRNKLLLLVALMLVAALVAVPLMLSKQPQAEAIAATTPANAAKTEGLPATFVSESDDTADADTGAETGSVKRKRTLGASKDPFEPAPLPKAKKSAKKKSAKAKAAKAEATATPTASSGSASERERRLDAPARSRRPRRRRPRRSRRTRSRSASVPPADAELKSRVLTKSTALPSSDDPAFVFDHLKNNGKVAVFMLTAAVTAEGDGKCLPTPENCQTLELKVGDTEFLTVTRGRRCDRLHGRHADHHAVRAGPAEGPHQAVHRRRQQRLKLTGGSR